jgi:hypothetical protein
MASVTTMTSRERILRTIAAKPVDRVPIFAPLPWHPLQPAPEPGDWHTARNYQALVARAAEVCDFFVQLEIPERTPFRNARKAYALGGVPEGIFDRRFLLVPPENVELQSATAHDGTTEYRYAVHTPRGALTTVEAIRPGEDTVWEIEPLVKSAEDAESLLAVPYRFDKPDMSSYYARRAELGERGVAVCFISSPLVMVSRLTGFQTFLEWTVTEKSLVERLIRTAQERVAERLQYVLANDAGPIFRFGGSEQATPPMMSGRAFDRYIVGYEGPLWEMVRAAGRIVWVHCHGRVRTVIDKFVDGGVQVMDPTEPPPQGDIEIGEAKRLAARGPMTLVGNIEFSELESRTPDEIAEQVRRAIEDGGKQRIILGASAEVIAGVSDRLRDNILAFIDAGLRYGVMD